MLRTTASARFEYLSGSGHISTGSGQILEGDRGNIGGVQSAVTRFHATEESMMLAKVFPIELKPGKQADAEAIVREFAPIGPGQEEGTLSFRVYRDKNRPDYLLFVEHFADQTAYDAHTGSSAYKRLVAGEFAQLITEFIERDHDLLVSY
jgi:quinol monooxygenase YgiN